MRQRELSYQYVLFTPKTSSARLWESFCQLPETRATAAATEVEPKTPPQRCGRKITQNSKIKKLLTLKP